MAFLLLLCSSSQLIAYEVATQSRVLERSITCFFRVPALLPPRTGGTQDLPSPPGLPPDTSPMPPAPAAVAAAGLPLHSGIFFPLMKTDGDPGRETQPSPGPELWALRWAESQSSFPHQLAPSWAPRPAPSGAFLPRRRAAGSSHVPSWSSGCSKPGSCCCHSPTSLAGAQSSLASLPRTSGSGQGPANP